MLDFHSNTTQQVRAMRKRKPQAEPLEAIRARHARRARMVELAVCVPIALLAAFVMAYAAVGLFWWPSQFPGVVTP